MNKLNSGAVGFDALPDEALVTVKTVAGVLSVCEITVWRLANAGHLKRIKLGEKIVRFSVGDIRNFIKGKKGNESHF